ncbi:MAG: hypothetical protein J6X51_04825 [Bacteroidales bacterium]|nr:hypothetical protein [Bacteroidales bacterium]
MMKYFRIILIIILITTIGRIELSAQDTPVTTDTTQTVRNAKSSSRARNEAIVKAEGNQPVERVHTTDSALQKKHSPKIAIALSAVLPGAGQVYNKKAWKIPIIYTCLGGGVALCCYFGHEMKACENEYLHRANGETALLDPELAKHDNETLISMKQSYMRYMEISIAATGVFYLLNIIDAAVDAHLYYFDISDDLTFHIRPYAQPSFLAAPAHAGVAFSLRWK